MAGVSVSTKHLLVSIVVFTTWLGWYVGIVVLKPGAMLETVVFSHSLSYLPLLAIGFMMYFMGEELIDRPEPGRSASRKPCWLRHSY